MCGFLGVIGSNNNSFIMEMSELINHRGPDDYGFWGEDDVLFAHRRLAIVDLSDAGHQPMKSKDGRYVLLFNGEIYNHKEIKAELKSKGSSFYSDSDTEVLLEAICQWGFDALSRLNGMWSFVVWDRVERKLLCSRDRFGKKPLYYYYANGKLFFSSEIKPLIKAIGEVEPDYLSICDFASKRILDHTERTFYKSIKQLPPGCNLEYKGGSIFIKKYWDIYIKDQCSSFTSNEILEKIESAIKIRSRCDVSVGVLLSGGIDSSSIASILAKNNPNQTFYTFSTVVEPAEPESQGIDQVLEMYPNIISYKETFSANDFYKNIEKCLWYQEEPFGDASVVAHFNLMHLAKEKGVKVLLTGQGADEVFAGYPAFINSSLIDDLKKNIGLFLLNYKKFKSNGYDINNSVILGSQLPLHLSNYIKKKKLINSISWLGGDYIKLSNELLDYEFDNNLTYLDNALIKSMKVNTLPGFLHYEDRNSMACGIETRLPFLDIDLINKVATIPSKYKMSDGLTKVILRNAVGAVVPKKIIQRKAKTGYPAPMSDWLKNIPSEQKEKWFSNVELTPYIDEAKFYKNYSNFTSGDNSKLHSVWRCLIVSMWHQMFIEGKCAI